MCAALLLLLGLTLGREKRDHYPLLHTRLPAITLSGIDGKDLPIGEIRGPAVINLFAHWCAPCLIEHPILQQIQSNGFPVYGIAWKDDPPKLRAWLAKHGSPYRKIGLDPAGQAALALGSSGVPESWVISREGTIIYHYAGALSPERAEEMLSLLKDE